MQKTIEIKTSNNKYNDLYKIILEKYFDVINRNLKEYIDTLLYSLAYEVKNEELLNYFLFSLIYYKFILPNDNKNQLDYIDSQIDFSNDLCLNMLWDLFNEKGKDASYLYLLSLLIVRFQDIKEVLNNCDYKIIKNAISKASLNIKNKKGNVLVEKKIILFLCEIEKSLSNINATIYNINKLNKYLFNHKFI